MSDMLSAGLDAEGQEVGLANTFLYFGWYNIPWTKVENSGYIRLRSRQHPCLNGSGVSGLSSTPRSRRTAISGSSRAILKKSLRRAGAVRSGASASKPVERVSAVISFKADTQFSVKQETPTGTAEA